MMVLVVDKFLGMTTDQMVVISNFALVLVTIIATHDTIRHDRQFMTTVLRMVIGRPAPKCKHRKD